MRWCGRDNVVRGRTGGRIDRMMDGSMGVFAIPLIKLTRLHRMGEGMTDTHTGSGGGIVSVKG